MTDGACDAAMALAGAVPELPPRTAFFASDPAGVRACLSLAAFLRQRHASATPRVYCNRDWDFGSEFSLPIVRLERAPGEDDVANQELVFCGTSHPESSRRFELMAIRTAARIGIPSVAFVDHLTNFRLRFEGEDGSLILPDEIWVLDDHAVAEAVADGLPAGRLRVSGSPTLAFLATLWRSKRTRAEIRAVAGVGEESGGGVVLYAPDPISLRGPDRIHGFDEVSGARDLAAALMSVAPDVTVLLRLHPLQPARQALAIEKAFDARGLRTVFPLPTAIGAELCTVADVVVGFYSNFLLEARVLGSSVIRYLPGAPNVDPLGHLDFGLKVADPVQLAAALAARLTGLTSAGHVR